MTLQTINRTIFQGDGIIIPFVITDSSGKAVDITHATFAWSAWNIDTGVVMPKTLGNGIALGTPADGQVAVTLVFTDTSTITPTQYTHQLETVLSGVHTIEANGLLCVQKNYTLL